MKKKPQWKKYEEAICRYYERKPGYRVERNKWLPAGTNSQAEFDVYAEFDLPDGTVVKTGILAKLDERKVDTHELRFLRTAFVDAGVTVGVIFCPEGLTKDATKLCQGYTNPAIYVREKSLSEVLQDVWGDDPLSALDNLAQEKESQEPNPETLEDVLRAVEDSPLCARFFFDKLTNPAWLPILLERGVFERCLGVLNEVPVPTDGDERREGLVTIKGGNEVPPLMASEYVRRFVEDAPDNFLAFCGLVKRSFFFLESDLIEAALRLPEGRRAEFVGIAMGWPFEGYLDPKPVCALVRDLYERGEEDAALEFLSKLTEVKAKPKKGFFEDEYLSLEAALPHGCYADLTVGFLPSLVQTKPVRVAEHVRDRLAEAVTLLQLGEPDKLPQYVHVAGLLDEQVYLDSDVLQLLIRTALAVMQAFGEIDPSGLARFVVEDLEGSRNGAFVRVGLVAAGETEGAGAEVVEAALEQDWLWRDYDVIYELHHLVKGAWPFLSEEMKGRVIDQVLNLKAMESKSGRISAEEAETYRLSDVCQWLLLLEPLGFPEGRGKLATEALRALKALTRETEYRKPEPLSYEWDDGTPDEATSFPDMTAEDVLAHCGALGPVRDDPSQRLMREGADGLRTEVGRRPSEFLVLRDALLALPYRAYAAAVVGGLEQALRNGVDVDRLSASDTVAALYDRPAEAEAPDRLDDALGGGHRDWIRLAAARFVEEAAQSDPEPLKTQGRLLALWERLWEGGDEGSGIVGDADVPMEVLNSEAGVLSLALCRLFARLTRPLSNDETDDEGAERLEWATRLLTRIDETLLAADSAVIRAPLGLFFTAFYGFDRDWAEDRSDRIFDRSNPKRWDAAWGLHFWLGYRNVEVFRHLRPHYEHAIEVMANVERSRRTWDQGVGQDLALFWMEGELKAKSRLVQDFWTKANDEAHIGAADAVLHLLSKSPDRATWRRAVGLWRVALKQRGRALGRGAGSRFLRWLKHAPSGVTVTSILKLLVATVAVESQRVHDDLFDFLMARVAEEPGPCAEVVLAIAESPSVRSGWTSMDRVWDVMVAIIGVGDEGAMETLVKARTALVTAGHFRFRDLPLPPRPREKDGGK